MKFWHSLFFAMLLFLAQHHQSAAQRHEIGGGAGICNSVNDINHNINFLFSRPGGQLFYRYNFSGAVVLRINVARVWVYGTDNQGGDPYQAVRGAEFNKGLWEGSTMLEYNFFGYRNPRKGQLWTPYLTGGFAMFRMPGAVPKVGGGSAGAWQPSIPFGIGLKWVLTGPWNLGLEFLARKTFTDYLDNLGDSYASLNFQRAIPDSRDWYYTTSLTLSYTFQQIDCKIPFIY